MAAKPAQKQQVSASEKSKHTPAELFKKRQSKELVIAFSGPIGCGLDSVVDTTEKLLTKAGYKVIRIKISDFIQEAIKKGLITLPRSDYWSGPAGRIEKLQDGGNRLRQQLKTADILAEFAVRKIAAHRTSQIPDSQSLEEYVPEATAYLIDQLKNPGEVTLFRTVYRNLFYLVGVLSVRPKREKRMLAKGMKAAQVATLIERDRKEPTDDGQQLDKTLELADFFVRNDHPNAEAVGNSIARFLKLIHGENGISPSREEYGMYVAYAAGLRSACLSRQVGAAVLDSKGNVLATGRNDVPKFGGGLYGPEDGTADARCVKIAGGHCHNEQQKRKMRGEIENILRDEVAATNERGESISRLVDRIYHDARIKDLIEFSRSIHAEMDAIVSLARSSTASSLGSTLYVTTYPCHSCARHIVAAGIERVYYIEPYEKSLASDLHEDSISTDPELVLQEGANRKLAFLHFEGVAPRQYLNLFRQQGERKTGGIAVEKTTGDLEKVVPEYLDNYQAFEAKVVDHLTELIDTDPPIKKSAA